MILRKKILIISLLCGFLWCAVQAYRICRALYSDAQDVEGE